MRKYIWILGLLFFPLYYTSAGMCEDFAGASLISPDGTFLGILNANEFAKQSIANEFGEYGSEFKKTSIFNEFGEYGSQFKQTSPWNEFAKKAPLIVKNGTTMGVLTLNEFVKGAQNTFDVLYCFISPSDTRLKPFAGLNPGWHALTYTVPGNNIGGGTYNLTEEQSCQLQYGSNATAGDPGYCKCKNGYKWNSSQTACIALTDSELCEQQYGSNATAGDPGKCKCKVGYVRSNDGTYCTKMTEDEMCQLQYGVHSYSPEDGYCNCEKGYEWNSAKTECIKSNNIATQATTTNTNPTNGGAATTDYYTSKSDELKDAIQWMYDNGLTMYNTIQDFLPYNEITREQASKFFVEFAAKILGKDRGIVYSYDIFSDLANANPSLKDHIIYANNMGLFQGSNGKFMPFNKLTKAQALAVAIRMVDGYLDESGTKPYDVVNGLGYTWFSQYASRANYSYGLNKWGSYSNFNTLDSEYITRGDMGLILYDMYLFRQNKCFYGELHWNGDDWNCERLGTGWEFVPGM